MTLTITLERKERMGALKAYIFYVKDTVQQAITLDMSPYLSHIFWADVHDITTEVYVSATWTDGGGATGLESITIGNEFTASDILKVIVIGS